MPHLLGRIIQPRGLIALLGALVAALALSSLAPSSASAGTPDCPYYNFCIWEHIRYEGGRFHYSGSDTNLRNDRFIGGSRGIVGGAGSSLQNNGAAHTYDAVKLYGYLGALDGCVPRGAAWKNLVYVRHPNGFLWNINDTIEGYRWVRPC